MRDSAEMPPPPAALQMRFARTGKASDAGSPAAVAHGCELSYLDSVVRAPEVVMTTPNDNREVTRSYRDPVDLIWHGLARRLGFDIRRTDDSYASYDGAGMLSIAASEHLDADDCLAQMVLHELCHALVQGRRAIETVDWALPNGEQEGLEAEYSAQRLQAHWADEVGMREFFAVTTQWRPHWEQLGSAPLDGDSRAAELARRGLEHARAWGWETHIQNAMRKTATIADMVHGAIDDRSLWSGSTGRHPTTGLPFSARADDGTRCGACVWGRFTTFEAPGVCMQSGLSEHPVNSDDRGCVRYELRFDHEECGRCGACCGEGFHAVEVVAGDALYDDARWVVDKPHGRFLPRPGGRCCLLTGQGGRGTPFRCSRYAERPTSCREFEVASANCLLARRRVGLSRG